METNSFTKKERDKLSPSDVITEALTSYSLPVLIVIINIPFIILGYFQIDKSFAINSVVAIVGLAIA